MGITGQKAILLTMITTAHGEIPTHTQGQKAILHPIILQELLKTIAIKT